MDKKEAKGCLDHWDALGTRKTNLVLMKNDEK